MITYEMSDDSRIRICLEGNQFVEICRRGKMVEIDVYRKRTVVERVPVSASITAGAGASLMGGSLTPNCVVPGCTKPGCRSSGRSRHPFADIPGI